MVRTRLIYRSLAEIVGSDGLAIITLTDEPLARALSIVCDGTMRNQLQMRAAHSELCQSMLPEVLSMMLDDYVKMQKLEIMIYSIRNGQYMVTLMNTDNYSIYSIRISDAILLNVIADVPIYIDEELMKAQSAPYNPNLQQVSIPINTLDTEKLKTELEKAVEKEDYRLASYIKEELNRRATQNDTKQ